MKVAQRRKLSGLGYFHSVPPGQVSWHSQHFAISPHVDMHGRPRDALRFARWLIVVGKIGAKTWFSSLQHFDCWNIPLRSSASRCVSAGREMLAS